MRTDRFHYELPPEAIAQSAVEPRDSSRLLVVDGLNDHRFSDLPGLLDPGDLVVVNRTRVRAARLKGRRRETDGAVEALLLERDGDLWEALMRPARRLRPGVVVDFEAATAEIVAGPEAGIATLRFETGDTDLEDLLPSIGEVPLPPYFTGTLANPERYQTMFAKTIGSAAAPTAALHFTPNVKGGLIARGVDIAEIDLVVGLDTFRPISSDTLEEHQIHTERLEVPAPTVAAVAATHRRGGKVVAIGTTVVRALESAAADGHIASLTGTTSLFITPGYRFGVVDRLVTNFHVPGSTLVVLIEAFMGPGWREAYGAALDRGYRFLSFGDAMLVDRL